MSLVNNDFQKQDLKFDIEKLREACDQVLKEKGFVDHIVTREKMKSTLYKIISILHE